MNRNQILVLVLALVMVLGLYFFPTKPSKRTEVDRTRAIEMETTDKTALLRKAMEKYSPEQLGDIRQFTDLAESATDDSTRIKWLENLSGAWFQIGEPALAGIYAEEIAEFRNNEESWSIAGTTYILGIKKYEAEDTKKFCQGRAIKALENAISENPDNTRHRTNLALCYVEMPPEDQPMKGILMLRDLLDDHPEDVGVLAQLGSLAIRTGQYEKAVERLEKAYSVQPDNIQVIRLLINAYQGMGDTANAAKFEALLNK